MKNSQVLSAFFIFCLLFSAIRSNCQTRIITTVAGDGYGAGTGRGGFSGDGGAATNAKLAQPRGVAVDLAGNIYIGDAENYVIRKVSPSGIISTIAGIPGSSGYSGDGGPALSAKLSGLFGICIDNSGNLFFADLQRIRKISTSGTITTVAGNGTAGYSGDGGNATAATIYNPYGLAVDAVGNLYIAEQLNNLVRKVSPSGIISTFAGMGTPSYSGDGGNATAAMLRQPESVAVDNSGNVFIADAGNNVIRKVSTSGIISTVAGTGLLSDGGDGGPATAANIQSPVGVAVDATGNIYIAEYLSSVRMVNTSGIISTIAGNGTAGYSGDGGPAVEAEFYYTWSLCLDGGGNIFVGDADNNVIRKISPAYLSVDQTELHNSSISIVPNPNTGAFTINAIINAKSGNEVSITITDITGRVIYSSVASTINSGISKEINLGGNLPGGLYILKLDSGNEHAVSRLLIAR